MMQIVPIIINFSTWLTLFRIFLAPCVMATIYYKMWFVACVVFIIAGATDFLDGYYARLYQQETEFGRLLDPVADKILIFSTLCALCAVSKQSLIPSWFIFLIAGKELVLLFGATFLIVQKKYTVLSPSLLSKWVTALLMMFILYLLLIYYFVQRDFEQILDCVESTEFVDLSLEFFAICTIFIMLDYSYKFITRIACKE
jgi:cardiolipin synthase